MGDKQGVDCKIYGWDENQRSGEAKAAACQRGLLQSEVIVKFCTTPHLFLQLPARR